MSPDTPVPTGASTSSTPTTAAAQTSGHHSLSAGAIAGIAVGGAIVALMAATLCFVCGRNRALMQVWKSSKPKENTGYEHVSFAPPPYGSPHPGHGSTAFSGGNTAHVSMISSGLGSPGVPYHPDMVVAGQGHDGTRASAMYADTDVVGSPVPPGSPRGIVGGSPGQVGAGWRYVSNPYILRDLQ